MEVDFDVAGNEAKDIILLGQQSGQQNQSFSHLAPYWQTEFAKIQESNETYKGRWNWPAFFFEGLWALTKGLWLSLLICIITCICTFGIAGFFWLFYYPIRGNYMYYKKIVKHENPIF